MNKVIFAIMPWLFAAIGYKATAQETPAKPEPPKESQEIIIRKKGEKDATVTVEFKDDKVLINGKPMIEFKDDAITINNRTFKFKEFEKGFENFGRGMEDFGREMELKFRRDNAGRTFKAGGNFLGVVTEKNDAGVKITELVKESAAEKAGLKEGDIITKIDDKKIEGPAELAETIEAFEPKKEIKIHYKRDGKEKTTKATLQERKAGDVRSFSFSMPNGGDVRAFTVPAYPEMPNPDLLNRYEDQLNNLEMHANFNRGPKLGLKIQDLEEGAGVKVLEVEEGSPAAKAGLQKDDVITEVGSVKVSNTDEARDQLHENAGKPSYSIGAKRNNTDMKFDIKIPKKLKTANL
jgi:serine protease Do